MLLGRAVSHVLPQDSFSPCSALVYVVTWKAVTLPEPGNQDFACSLVCRRLLPILLHVPAALPLVLLWMLHTSQSSGFVLWYPSKMQVWGVSSQPGAFLAWFLLEMSLLSPVTSLFPSPALVQQR